MVQVRKAAMNTGQSRRPGGPAHDALIAFTAVEHQATLLSLDHRATPTYEAVGATVEQLVP